MSNEVEDCPCEKCLVKIQCRNKIVRSRKDEPDKEYLIMGYTRKCPMLFNYFYKSYIEGKRQDHEIVYQDKFYSRVEKCCDIHNVPGNSFLWYGHEIGIYE